MRRLACKQVVQAEEGNVKDEEHRLKDTKAPQHATNGQGMSILSVRQFRAELRQSNIGGCACGNIGLATVAGSGWA